MLRLFSKNSSSNEKLTPERKKQLKVLCEKLKVKVRDLELLDRALTHSSCRDKTGKMMESYERLEFLGDSVLSLSVSYILYHTNPSFAEGKLSAIRSSVVDEITLAEIGAQLDIYPYINLGKGEQLKDERAKKKVFADIMESIIAVLFLDGGYEKAFKFVEQIMYVPIEQRLTEGTRDYKTRLQQYSIERFKEYPSYAVVGERGPDHNKIFQVEVTVAGKYKGSGMGRSKKEAEQKAAYKVLKRLRPPKEGETAQK